MPGHLEREGTRERRGSGADDLDPVLDGRKGLLVRLAGRFAKVEPGREL